MAPKRGHVFKPMEDRLFDKISPDPNSGCWIWTGADNGFGYGTMTMGVKTRAYAHRVCYEFHCGKIPDGLYIDHLCRNTFCVNPAYLEPVTNAENARRGETGNHMKGRKRT